ncbi:MAG: BglII/BstYI family type II restriction endonuclease [Candidatus Acidiferrales bacterium]
MALDVIAGTLQQKYHIEERRHACAILASDFPAELQDIVGCLGQFQLVRSEIEVGGGGKSKIANRFDGFLKHRGWVEKSVKVSRTVGNVTSGSETHKVDFFKGRVAVEVEWNNKDPFFSRDLNAFRLLHELDVISVGVLITRMDELQKIFDKLGKKIGKKYGSSTTHWGKLMPRIEAGGAGACPLLLVGITANCYIDDLSEADHPL